MANIINISKKGLKFFFYSLICFIYITQPTLASSICDSHQWDYRQISNHKHIYTNESTDSGNYEDYTTIIYKFEIDFDGDLKKYIDDHKDTFKCAGLSGACYNGGVNNDLYGGTRVTYNESAGSILWEFDINEKGDEPEIEYNENFFTSFDFNVLANTTPDNQSTKTSAKIYRKIVAWDTKDDRWEVVTDKSWLNLDCELQSVFHRPKAAFDKYANPASISLIDGPNDIGGQNDTEKIATVKKDQTISYSLKTTNNASDYSPLQQVVIKDTLPANVTFSQFTNPASCNGRTIERYCENNLTTGNTCPNGTNDIKFIIKPNPVGNFPYGEEATAGALGPGQSCTLSYQAKVKDDDGQEFKNNAWLDINENETLSSDINDWVKHKTPRPCSITGLTPASVPIDTLKNGQTYTIGRISGAPSNIQYIWEGANLNSLTFNNSNQPYTSTATSVAAKASSLTTRTQNGTISVKEKDDATCKATATITPSPSDLLEFTKSADLAENPSPQAPYDPRVKTSITYTLTYKNKSSSTLNLSNLVITDILEEYGLNPPEFVNPPPKNISSPGAFNSSNNKITWNIGSISLGAGASKSVSFTVTPNPNYTVNVEYEVTNKSDLSATLPISGDIDLTSNELKHRFKILRDITDLIDFTKSADLAENPLPQAPYDPRVKTSITYTLTYKNKTSSTLNLSNLIITDILEEYSLTPPEFVNPPPKNISSPGTFNSSNNKITWNIGSVTLGAGASKSVSFIVTPNPNYTVNVEYQVTNKGDLAVTLPETGNVSLTSNELKHRFKIPAPPKCSVEKLLPATLPISRLQVGYLFTINQISSPDPNLDYVWKAENLANPTFDGQTPPYTSKKLQLLVKASDLTNKTQNGKIHIEEKRDPTCSAESIITPLASDLLDFTKSADLAQNPSPQLPYDPRVNKNIKYTLTYKNKTSSTLNLTNLVITDLLEEYKNNPPELINQPHDISDSGSYNSSSNKITWNLGSISLTSGQSKFVTFIVNVNDKYTVNIEFKVTNQGILDATLPLSGDIHLPSNILTHRFKIPAPPKCSIEKLLPATLPISNLQGGFTFTIDQISNPDPNLDYVWKAENLVNPTFDGQTPPYTSKKLAVLAKASSLANKTQNGKIHIEEKRDPTCSAESIITPLATDLLEFTKSADLAQNPSPQLPYDPRVKNSITYTLTYKNKTTDTLNLSNLIITDLLEEYNNTPPELASGQPTAISAPGIFNSTNKKIIWNLDSVSLAAGDSNSVTFTVAVNDKYPVNVEFKVTNQGILDATLPISGDIHLPSNILTHRFKIPAPPQCTIDELLPHTVSISELQKADGYYFTIIPNGQPTIYKWTGQNLSNLNFDGQISPPPYVSSRLNVNVKASSLTDKAQNGKIHVEEENNPACSAESTITPLASDLLEFSKSSDLAENPTPANPYDPRSSTSITYTLTYKNKTADTLNLSNLIITDILEEYDLTPPEFVNPPPTNITPPGVFNNIDKKITWNLGSVSLGAGASASVSFTVTPNPNYTINTEFETTNKGDLVTDLPITGHVSLPSNEVKHRFKIPQIVTELTCTSFNLTPDSVDINNAPNGSLTASLTLSDGSSPQATYMTFTKQGSVTINPTNTSFTTNYSGPADGDRVTATYNDPKLKAPCQDFTTFTKPTGPGCTEGCCNPPCNNGGSCPLPSSQLIPYNSTTESDGSINQRVFTLSSSPSAGDTTKYRWTNNLDESIYNPGTAYESKSNTYEGPYAPPNYSWIYPVTLSGKITKVGDTKILSFTDQEWVDRFGGICSANAFIKREGITVGGECVDAFIHVEPKYYNEATGTYGFKLAPPAGYSLTGTTYTWRSSDPKGIFIIKEGGSGQGATVTTSGTSQVVTFQKDPNSQLPINIYAQDSNPTFSSICNDTYYILESLCNGSLIVTHNTNPNTPNITELSAYVTDPYFTGQFHWTVSGANSGTLYDPVTGIYAYDLYTPSSHSDKPEEQIKVLLIQANGTYEEVKGSVTVQAVDSNQNASASCQSKLDLGEKVEIQEKFIKMVNPSQAKDGDTLTYDIYYTPYSNILAGKNIRIWDETLTTYGYIPEVDVHTPPYDSKGKIEPIPGTMVIEIPAGSSTNGDNFDDYSLYVSNLQIGQTIHIQFKAKVNLYGRTSQICGDHCMVDYGNTAKRDLMGQDTDSFVDYLEAKANVWVWCPYLLTRNGGDVYFEEDLTTGADLAACDSRNTTGLALKKEPPEDQAPPKTGTPDWAFQSLSLCDDQNNNVNSSKNANPIAHFSSFICEIKTTAEEVWQKSNIETLMTNNNNLVLKAHPEGLKTTTISDFDNFTDYTQPNPNEKIYYINNTDLTIGTGTTDANGDATNIPIYQQSGKLGGMTFIIKDHDLHIKNNIIYYSSVGSTNNHKEIPSIAFIVQNGNILIDPSVTTLVGVYYAQIGDRGKEDSGKLKSSSGSSNKKLIIKGSAYGDLEDLLKARTHAGDPKKDEGAIVINYDERILLNTPPGLQQFVKMSWDEVAR